MVNRMKKKIALLLENYLEPGRAMIRGITKFANQFEDWTFYNFTPYEYWEIIHSTEQEILDNIREWGADGVISSWPNAVIPLIEDNVPTVLTVSATEEWFDSVPKVVVDLNSISNMAINYFRSKGFKNFAYCGIKNALWSQQRRDSFVNSMKRCNINYPLHDHETLKNTKNWSDRIITLSEWLISLPRPIAILCCNDLCGVDVIEAARAADLKIPSEIAVLGIDNDELICQMSMPNLSSIAVNFEYRGWKAAKTLNDLITGGNNVMGHEIVVYPQKVITRQSTDISSVGNPVVIDALNYIEKHKSHFFSVDDVAFASSVSRRTLERQFKTCIGYTIHEQIKQVLVQNISQALLYNKNSIEEIAIQMGLQDAKNLSRYFKKETGLTPSQFKKKHGQK
jgi:LacI family transcriptional regulator